MLPCCLNHNHFLAQLDAWCRKIENVHNGIGLERIIIRPSLEAVFGCATRLNSKWISHESPRLHFKSEGALVLLLTEKSLVMHRIKGDIKIHVRSFLAKHCVFMFATPKWIFCLIYTRNRARDKFFMIARRILAPISGRCVFYVFQRRRLPDNVTRCFSLISQPPGLLALRSTWRRGWSPRSFQALFGILKFFEPLQRGTRTQTTNCNLIWCMTSQHLFYFSPKRDKLLWI